MSDDDVDWGQVREVTVASLDWLAADLQTPGAPLPSTITDLPDDQRTAVVAELDNLRATVVAKAAEFTE